jgi:hypothetical protein
MVRAIALLLVLSLAFAARAEKIRIATYNASLSPDTGEGPGSLPARLAKPGDEWAERVAEIIQRIDPDVLLVNEFNWDAAGAAADGFARNFLSAGRDGTSSGSKSRPIAFPYRYLPSGNTSPFNTGVTSGHDLDGNGQRGDPGDAYGFGQFPGQYGMVVFSKYPIKTDQVRTFQQFRWRDIPDNLLPREFYSPEEIEQLRLSSKSHWDIPIDVHGHTLHVLASHPTPPVFDGPEDRNGRRNFDEIRFWRDYVTPGAAGYVYDDAEFAAAGGRRPANPKGGLPAGASFVVMGDQNADPTKGSSYPGAINQLLESPRVNAAVTPRGTGGAQATPKVVGDAAPARDSGQDTAAFGDSGNLRVDYVLPSSDIEIVAGHVYWFADDEPLFQLMTHGGFPSDHRAVFIDVKWPPSRKPVQQP